MPTMVAVLADSSQILSRTWSVRRFQLNYDENIGVAENIERY